MTDDERSRLAYAIQGIMADELWADPDFDVNGTGPASFKIADLLRSELANARNAALREALEGSIAMRSSTEKFYPVTVLFNDLSSAQKFHGFLADECAAIRAFKAEGESRTPVETGES